MQEIKIQKVESKSDLNAFYKMPMEYFIRMIHIGYRRLLWKEKLY